MKITKRQLRETIRRLILNEASRGIMHIIKKNQGKRLKKPHRAAPSQYEFPDERTAANVVWEISSETGREAANSGKIVTVYT